MESPPPLLLACPSAELWRSYTRYMVKTNDPTTEEGVQTIKAAFEYTMDAVGEDVDAGPLWLDCVTFLQSVDATHACPDAAGEHAESARMQEVRRAYQRAVSVPTTSIDALYREYDAFETKLSPTLAKALLAEVKPRVRARSATRRARERKRGGTRSSWAVSRVPRSRTRRTSPRRRDSAGCARALIAGEDQSAYLGTAARGRGSDGRAGRNTSRAWRRAYEQALCR